MSHRIELDSLGQKHVAADCYVGIQTTRALENFQVSCRTIGEMPDLIKALGMVKKAAAVTNAAIGAIETNKAQAIAQACDEIISGVLHDAFVVDPMQGGAGTSTNMNANEVIANRALEILGEDKGNYAVVHPLNHVNRSQSTNDSYATAVRLSLYFLNDRFANELAHLQKAFQQKAEAFDRVPKLGRTQLQDAVPMTVGAELQAYAVTISEDVQQARNIGALFLEVNIGGTAIGSGVGAAKGYSNLIIRTLAQISGLPLKRSRSLYEASWDMGAFVLYSALIKRVAVKLSKISNDLRLLSSGPSGGLGEYVLPARQPGSSIMPDKVNPVIPELMNQVCFRAFGADTTVTFAAEAGQLQLNAMEPVIVWTISETAEMLIKAMVLLRVNCVDGLQPNVERCKNLLEESTALAACLVPYTGYDQAVGFAKGAKAAGVPFKEYIASEHPELMIHLE